MVNDLLVFTCDIFFMVLLNLCAAFDIIDLDILISRLENKLCFGRQIPIWFRSYLTDNCQFVQTSQSLKKIQYGAPQGSDLGSPIFPLNV